MSLALTRENFFWHKVHSLTGIIPVGFYMVQHLTLNSFTIAGERNFNGVLAFFESMPKHFLLLLEIVAIWIPLLFHAVYGLFIVNRAEVNVGNAKYRWSQNRMYAFQRATGIFIFLFLAIHIAMTTGTKYYTGSLEPIQYAAFQQKLSANGYLLLILYVLGITASAYHLAYGIWNFCIRWGISISERAQLKVQKFAAGAFIALTLLGWAALAGFFMHKPMGETQPDRLETLRIEQAL